MKWKTTIHGRDFMIETPDDTPPTDDEIKNSFIAYAEQSVAQRGKDQAEGKSDYWADPIVKAGAPAVDWIYDAVRSFAKTPDQKRREEDAKQQLPSMAAHIPDDQERLKYMNDRRLERERLDAGLGFTPQKGDITNDAQAVAAANRKAGGPAVRAGTPVIAAGLMGTGVGTPLGLAMLAASGVLGNRAGKLIEGDESSTSIPEDINAAAGGMMIAPVTKPMNSLAAFLGGGTAGGALEVSNQAAQGRGFNEIEWNKVIPAFVTNGLAYGIESAGVNASAKIGDARLQQALNNWSPAQAQELEAFFKQADDDAISGLLRENDKPPMRMGSTPTTIDEAAEWAKVDADAAAVEARAAAGKDADAFAKDATKAQNAFGPKASQSLDELMASEKAAEMEATKAKLFEETKQQLRAARELEEGGFKGPVRVGIAPTTADLEKQWELVAHEANAAKSGSRMADQSGKVDPTVMYAVGRSAAGAIAGMMYGDDPAEDAKYSTAFAMLAALSSPKLFRHLSKETKVGRWMLTEVKADPFMDAIHGRRGREQSLMSRVVFGSRDTEAFVKTLNPGQKQDLKRITMDYLTTSDPAALAKIPAQIRDDVQSFRTWWDDRMDDVDQLGVMSDSMAKTVKDRRGKHMRRTYEAFINPKYLDNVPLAKKEAWIKGHVEAAIKNGSPKTRAELTQNYKDALFKFLDKKNPAGREAFLETGHISPTSGTLAKRSLDENNPLDKLTMDLLGPIDDPFVVINDMIPRVAKLQAKAEMEAAIAKIGLGNGMFRKGTGDLGGSWVPVGNPDLPGPYKGLYTQDKGVIEVLNTLNDDTISNLSRYYGYVSSATKATKTLGSVAAYSTNALNQLADLFIQGHVPSAVMHPLRAASALKLAGNAVLTNFGKRPSKQFQNMWEIALEEQIVDRSISVNDFQTHLQSWLDNPHGKVSKAGASAMRGVGKLYQLPETFGKVFALGMEYGTLKKAWPNMADRELWKQAAEKVRDTNTHFDRLPRAVKAGSKFAMLDPFVSYVADRYRVTYNTYRLGMNEVASGNPILRRQGFRRMAGITAALGAGAYAASNRHLSKEKEEAYRNQHPEWDKYAPLAIDDSRMSKDGTFSSVNLNYILPHTVTTEAMLAASRGDSPKQAADRFLASMRGQFLGKNTVMVPVFEAAQGKTMEGKEIWNDVDDDKAAKGFGYIGKEWFDLPARKEMNRVWEIKTHGPRPGGPTLGDIAKKQLLGYRKNNYDFMQNVTFNAARNSHSLTSAMSAYSRAQRNLLDKDEIEKAYQEFNTRRLTIAGNTIQNVKDMRAVGKSDTEIMKALKSASLPSLMIKGALDGLPPEQIVAVMGSPDKKLTAADKLEEIMAEAKEHPEGGDVIKRLSELGKTDYPMYKRVWAQYKGQQKENALGYEGTDGMIHSMSESDGTRARYLGTRYQNLVSTSGREQAVQYLKGLEKKGLIGPATRQALIQAGVSSR